MVRRETLSIVCGAPNVAAGQKVAVAKVGHRSPATSRSSRSKIRGVESFGMICSERELGLGDEHDGIWVLPAEPSPGTPSLGALELERLGRRDRQQVADPSPRSLGPPRPRRELAAILRAGR
jgi:tRNA-binding EMAP/Myf-like protein